MNNETINTFVLWLENASETELDMRRQEIVDVMPRIRTRQGHSDVRLAQRLLDEEAVARLELARARQR